MDDDAPLHEGLSEQIIGSALEVHSDLGPGFLESVYENSLVHQLRDDGMAFVHQKRVNIFFKDQHVGYSQLDLLVVDKLVVELKAIDDIAPIHVTQTISYLKATDLQVGLIINFNVRRLKDGIKRVIYTPEVTDT